MNASVYLTCILATAARMMSQAAALAGREHDIKCEQQRSITVTSPNFVILCISNTVRTIHKLAQLDPQQQQTCVLSCEGPHDMNEINEWQLLFWKTTIWLLFAELSEDIQSTIISTVRPLKGLSLPPRTLVFVDLAIRRVSKPGRVKNLRGC